MRIWPRRSAPADCAKGTNGCDRAVAQHQEDGRVEDLTPRLVNQGAPNRDTNLANMGDTMADMAGH